MSFDLVPVFELSGAKLPLRLRNLLDRMDAVARAAKQTDLIWLFAADYSALDAFVAREKGKEYGAPNARWRGRKFATKARAQC